uniref:Uncharacterized protein n=1 Tax=Arundo donax TaxID=35708 RepID=A0A0A9AYJ6_ARUDO
MAQQKCVFLPINCEGVPHSASHFIYFFQNNVQEEKQSVPLF